LAFRAPDRCASLEAAKRRSFHQPELDAKSRMSPSREMPRSNIRSNSAAERRGALVLPPPSPACGCRSRRLVVLIWSMRRTSRRIEAELQRIAARSGLGLPNMTPIFMRTWLMNTRHARSSRQVAGQLAQRLTS
jgi:hypothetical protein